MEVIVQVINGFTDNGQGGNPAGVVLHAERFSQGQKQHIAARAGFSETAFVSPSQTAAYKLEFFTPARQIAHCGHATIATFGYLYQNGHITQPHSSKETIDGNRDIFFQDGCAFMEQRAPRYASINTQAVLASLGIEAEQLLPNQEPVIGNTGNSFALVPLRDEAAVLGVQPDWEAIEQLSLQHHLVGYYVFSPQTRGAGRVAGARMFAPVYGIPEESATGTAAGPLGCYLYDYLGYKQERLVIEQGQLMTPAAPSELIVQLNLQDGQIASLLVGGQATVMRTLTLEI